jgi:hypothetical protein
VENGTEIKSADLKVSHVVQHDLKAGMPRDGKQAVSINVTVNMGGTTPLWAQVERKYETTVTIRPAKRPAVRLLKLRALATTPTNCEKKDEKNK